MDSSTFLAASSSVLYVCIRLNVYPNEDFLFALSLPNVITYVLLKVSMQVIQMEKFLLADENAAQQYFLIDNECVVRILRR